jgi:hypothetical protein
MIVSKAMFSPELPKSDSSDETTRALDQVIFGIADKRTMIVPIERFGLWSCHIPLLNKGFPLGHIPQNYAENIQAHRRPVGNP